MPIIPKLECRVETFREDGAVFMRIGIHQEEMLLAYYAFDTLLTGFADKIALHDHENGADCEIVDCLSSGEADDGRANFAGRERH